MDMTLKLKNGSDSIDNTESLFENLNEAAKSKGVSLDNANGAGKTFLSFSGNVQKQVELARKACDDFISKASTNVGLSDKAREKARDAAAVVSAQKSGFGVGAKARVEAQEVADAVADFKAKSKKIINKTKGFFGLTNKARIKAQGAADAIIAQKAKEAERNKNEAFKFGLGLITCGTLFGMLMFPNMKDQFAQLIDNGKPVMEKVFAALKVLVNAAIVFIPMALGALLLWFSFSEQGPEKGGMIEKIIQASMAFLIGIEDAIFGVPKEEAPEMEETPKTEETKAMIQQRIAMLQMDLAQIAHDLA